MKGSIISQQSQRPSPVIDLRKPDHPMDGSSGPNEIGNDESFPNRMDS